MWNQQVTLQYNSEERYLSVQVHGYRIKVKTNPKQVHPQIKVFMKITSTSYQESEQIYLQGINEENCQELYLKITLMKVQFQWNDKWCLFRG